MKKVISLFLILLLSLLSIYAITDIIGSIYLVSRYENVDLSSSGIIAGKILFTAICIGFIFVLAKIARRKRIN